MLWNWILFILAALPLLAQAPADLAGDWKGTLTAGGASLRLALHIEKASDGLYLGKLNSLDQGAVLPVDSFEVAGDKVRFTIKAVGGTFEGTLSGNTLKGTWAQAALSIPIEFTRDASAAAPAAPKPPKLTTAVLTSFGVPVDLSVPAPPVPALIAGKTQLLYELHLTNASGATMDLKRLEVWGDGRKLVAYEGAELNRLLYRTDISGGGDMRSIPPGVHAAVFLNLSFDTAESVPARLTHRLAVEDVTTEGGAVAVSREKALVLGPPLRGDGWFAANGPSNESIHRRAMAPFYGQFHVAQRFAIDWLKVGADGKTFSGDAKDNRSYRAYGAEVLAVANGTVIEVKDGIAENVPDMTARAVAMSLDTLGGNHIVIDLGGGRFAFYAHLQPGKLRVKVGDRVARGQVLGLLGNSGNSTEPHLHFHVSDGPVPLGSEGLPYTIDSLGALPAQNARVKFPAQ